MRITFPICLGSSKVKLSPSVPKVPGSNPSSAHYVKENLNRLSQPNG